MENYVELFIRQGQPNTNYKSMLVKFFPDILIRLKIRPNPFYIALIHW